MGNLYGERAFDVKTGTDDRVALASQLRQRLAGEDRFIDTGDAFVHQPICRNGLTRAYQHFIAWDEFHCRYQLERAAGIEAMRACRAHLANHISRIGCTFSGGQFQSARAQQQEHKHADRIEVHLATSAGSGKRAGAEGQSDAQSYRQIHSSSAVGDIAPGRSKERPRRVQQHRQGQ